MQELSSAPGPIRIERIAAWLIVASLAVICLIYFSDFLQPLVLAVMFWYFIYVLKGYTGKIHIKGKRLPEWLLTVLVFVIIILITIGVVEMVTYNLELIIQRFPIYMANYRRLFESVQTIEGFEIIQERVIGRMEEFDFKPLLTGLLNGLSGIAGNIFMIIIYVIFLMVEEKLFNKKIDIMVKNSPRAANYNQMLQEVNEAVRTYVLVKTQMSLLTGFLSYIILLIFGIDFPLLWAFLIFLMNYIPYIGSLIATLLPAGFAIFQFQSFIIFVWIFLAIQIVQVLVGNILEPKVMGKTLNLSPLGVLLALTFWGLIWGILGMIISVPITSIMVIIASRVPGMRFIAVWLSETGKV
jgi:predicted PurR-regulated permease PerM